jgi:tetratricopeptide (TPR) repeat protein
MFHRALAVLGVLGCSFLIYTSANAGLGRFLSELAQSRNQLAAAEYAIGLRLRDHNLWLAYGLVLDRLNATEDAFVAYQEASRLAPFYANPKWKLGNALFRAGRVREGMLAMRLAAKSDPSLLPALIDLTWTVSGKSEQIVEQVVEPGTSTEHAQLAIFFAQQGKEEKSLEHFLAAGTMLLTNTRNSLAR